MVTCAVCSSKPCYAHGWLYKAGYCTNFSVHCISVLGNEKYAFWIINLKQECIPVGCIPTACCPYLPVCTALGGCTCQGVYLPGVYLPGGCTCQGVYLPGGCTCLGVYLPRGVPAWGRGGCTCQGVYLLGGVPARGVYLPRGCIFQGVYLPGVGVYMPEGVDLLRYYSL